MRSTAPAVTLADASVERPGAVPVPDLGRIVTSRRAPPAGGEHSSAQAVLPRACRKGRIRAEEMHHCLETCLNCYRTCLGTAMNHWLVAGRKHVEPAHLRPMMACADICRTSVHFMLLNTPHHKHTCRECAEICAECAEDCERVGGMEACVAMCQTCAESCRKMAALLPTGISEWTSNARS